MASHLMKLEHITKTYRSDGRTFCALNDASLCINEHENISLVGESGAGKSTFATIIAGLKRPTKGVIYWNDQDINQLTRQEKRGMRQKIQMVSQDPTQTFDQLRTVGYSIREALLSYKLCTRVQARERCENLLERVGLSKHYASHRPSELSGGQLQRASIARALACEPELLVLDEVTSALDMTVQEKILQLLETLRQEQKVSMLFVHHDLAVAQRMSDRIIVMKDAEIVTECAASQLSSCEHPYVRKLIASIYTL